MEIEECPANNLAVRKNCRKLFRLMQPVLRAEVSISRHRMQALDAQTMTALGATSGQNGTTTTGTGTNEETMGTLAAYDGRLIGTFHGGFLRLK